MAGKRSTRSTPAFIQKAAPRPVDFNENRYPEDFSGDDNEEETGVVMGQVKGVKAAVLASLLLGETPSRIAKQYNLPEAYVKRWHVEFDITSPIQRRDQLSQSLLIYIEQEIKNLISIGIITSDEEWVKWQNASDLSAFVQVKGSVIMQLLTAFGRASQQAAELKQREIEVLDSDDA